ncbi:MAG: NtaA/DmoA family FMN-dependent monooxygenase [Pseudaminobacter sp.]
MTKPRHLILNLNPIPGGIYAGAWRTGDRPADSFIKIEHFVELAKIAERGKLDALFLADTGGAFSAGTEYRPFRPLDPTVVLSYVAAATTRLGLISTVSSSYDTPYNLARRILSLDHVSKGRAAWNIVVTAGDDSARNFSLERALPKEQRYARGREFLEIVKALWLSWEPDGVLADPVSGRYIDPSKAHAINFAGEHFKVEGPLVTPRSVQGSPVIVQAGGSEGGTDLAGRFAHAVYSTQPEIEGARRYRTELRERATRYGRNPDTIKLLPGLITIVGSTEREAKERSEYLLSLIPDRAGINLLSEFVRLPKEVLTELDSELPWELIPEESLQGVSHTPTLLRRAKEHKLTIRQLIAQMSAVTVHTTAVGSAEQIADKLQHWFETGAVDGFNVMPAELPKGISDFVDQVLPILRQRGLFREEYETETLRGHYGLGEDD